MKNFEQLKQHKPAAAAENFINCLRQRRRRLENLKIFSVIGGGGSAARLTPLIVMEICRQIKSIMINSKITLIHFFCSVAI
jgi:hypothetical protein